MADHLLFGLDIGGTSTHGIRAQRLGHTWVISHETQGPSSNLQNASPQQAQAALTTVARELGFTALPANTSVQVVAGAGGVDTPADAHALRTMILKALRPFAAQNVTIVHDTRLILAAGDVDSGIAVIAGTGSVAWGRNTQGHQARSGGWGHMLGDEGSAWWLGKESVRRALQRHDNHIPADELDTAILHKRALTTRDQLIADFHTNPHRTQWASLAHIIDRLATNGHTDSHALLEQAGSYLATAAHDVASQLKISGPVIAGGGLIKHSTHLQKAFHQRCADFGLSSIHVLDSDPVRGTIRLATS